MTEEVAQRCGNCRWWVAGSPANAAATRDPLAVPFHGACHVYPPEARTSGWRENQSGVFPVTHEDRFCAMWEGLPGGRDPDDGEEATVDQSGGEVVPIRPNIAA